VSDDSYPSWGSEPTPVPATPVTNPKAGYYFIRGLQPFDDARVREAVFLVIDELAIWEELSYFPNGDHNVDSQLPFDHRAIRGLDIEVRNSSWLRPASQTASTQDASSAPEKCLK
jgi:hypothetical protein